MNRPDAAELIPTRQSLLSRLKDWNDNESWREFFDTYWRLIYNAALRAGLTDAEAQDVVQETLLSVSKNMTTFRYDAEGSFKSWLLRLTTWRVTDQFRKRRPGLDKNKPHDSTDTGTATLERIADPAGLALEALWDEEWESNLLNVALERVKTRVSAKHYQVFSFYVLRGWPVLRVARALKVSPTVVYLAKHRVGRLVKQEIERLQTKPANKTFVIKTP